MSGDEVRATAGGVTNPGIFLTSFHGMNVICTDKQFK